MTKKIETYTYTTIPNPHPVRDHECISCGYDPIHIWEGHDIIGGDWNARIDARGQLCLNCALEGAGHLARQYPAGNYPDWRRK